MKNGGTAIERTAAAGGINWGLCHFLKHPNCPGTTPDLSKPRGSIWHNPLIRLMYGDDAALFSVVRNPYERTLSYYYYVHRGKNDIDKWDDTEHLNEFVKDRLGRNRFTGYFYPAFCYIFETAGDQHFQVADYVLRFEDLDNEFEELMKEFSLNIKLGYTNTRRKDAKMGVEAFSDESIALINNYFYNDFIAFGYDMKQV